ncbi:MAG: hypothetical protein JW909_13055 [Planctomycetes bacterium]|nr:hypothetical protein [Planctomycetota bacterium]
MNPGDAFRFTRGKGDDHLWLILTDPARDSDCRTVIVNITTYRAEKDHSCLLDVGDHPFIRHRTCIAYDYARIIKANRLEKLETDGIIHFEQPFSADVLRRIMAGAVSTRKMPIRVQDFVLAHA